MIIGMRENRAHERRRRIWRLIKWLTVLVILATFGTFMYQTGATVARNELESSQSEAATLKTAVAELRQTATQATIAADQATQREAQLRRQYEQDVPTGDAKPLLVAIKRQLDAGIDAKRLAFIISSATPNRACDKQPQTKRFLVKTPITPGSAETASFGDGAVTIAAEGESALDPEGKRQAWFDPQKPVTVRFILLGGGNQVATGVLPIEKSVVRGDAEHRFIIAPTDRRGFVSVTAERCKFP